MNIVEFRNKYLDEVISLIEGYRIFYGGSPSDTECREFVLNLQETNGSKIFLAIDDKEQAIGFANLYPSYSTLSLQKLWILNDLFVAEKARGLGVSKALLNEVLSFAKNDGAIRIELKTDIPNKIARELYCSVGFIEDQDNVYYRVPV